ncbi:MAG: hypothetical protein CR217_10450 [Beijerinckiaceae bacterium]|nr:MAG: hypothetical protein CR217_10450 [Beijerinckiaceae bacterium]
MSKRYIGFLIERDASRARRQFGWLWWPKFSNQPRDGILRWQAGEQHWSVIQTGFGQAGNYALEPVRADELELSRTRPQGGVIRLDPWTGIEVTGSRPGDGLSPSFRKARTNLPSAGQIGGILVAWRARRATLY